GAGKLTYDWMMRAAELDEQKEADEQASTFVTYVPFLRHFRFLMDQDVKRYFFITLLMGFAIGAAIQLPPLLLDPKESDWYVPGSTLGWWFGLRLGMALWGMLLPRPAGESNPRVMYALDAAAAITLAVVIGLHLNIVGDWGVSRINILWMQSKVQGFLTGMYQYVPELCKTLRLPRSAPDYDQMTAILSFGVPILFCYAWVMRPVRFGLGLGAILLAAG